MGGSSEGGGGISRAGAGSDKDIRERAEISGGEFISSIGNWQAIMAFSSHRGRTIFCDEGAHDKSLQPYDFRSDARTTEIVPDPCNCQINFSSVSVMPEIGGWGFFVD